MTRRTKTPKERAEEALAAAQRRVARLGGTRARLETDLTIVRAEHEAAIKRRDYLATDPALSSEEDPA